MAHVLFVCVHNAGRSQMSAALFNRAAEGRHSAESAGTHPAASIHPQVVEAMHEVGIDLSGVSPRALTTELVERVDLVVTMGCGDECPVLPGKRYLDWALADPHDMDVAGVRALIVDIDERVRGLVRELDEEGV